MRILLVNDTSTPRGGAEIYALRLREQLRRRGHTAALAACAVGPSDQQQADFEAPGIKGGTKISKGIRWLYNSAAIRRFREILGEFRPDVVHLNLFVYHFSIGVLSALGSLPTVYTAPGSELSCPQGIRVLSSGRICRERGVRACVRCGCYPTIAIPWLWAREHLIARYQHHIDLAIAPSSWILQDLRSLRLPRCTRLPTGVPLQSSMSHNGNGSILYVGRLAPVKGVEVLIAAMKLIRQQKPDTRLLVAGDGPSRRDLQELVEKEGLNGAIEFLGWIASDSLRKLHSSASVLAVPSYFENLPTVVVEAQALGTPVVASNVGGIPDLIRDGETGLLAEPGDAEELARQICYMLDNPDHAQQMARQAREFVERECSMDVHVDRLLELYRETISRY